MIKKRFILVAKLDLNFFKKCPKKTKKPNKTQHKTAGCVFCFFKPGFLPTLLDPDPEKKKIPDCTLHNANELTGLNR